MGSPAVESISSCPGVPTVVEYEAPTKASTAEYSAEKPTEYSASKTYLIIQSIGTVYPSKTDFNYKGDD